MPNALNAMPRLDKYFPALLAGDVSCGVNLTYLRRVLLSWAILARLFYDRSRVCSETENNFGVLERRE